MMSLSLITGMIENLRKRMETIEAMARETKRITCENVLL
jgi:hypothetical protein